MDDRPGAACADPREPGALDWLAVVMPAGVSMHGGSRQRGVVLGAFFGLVAGIIIGFTLAPAALALPSASALTGLLLGALTGLAASVLHDRHAAGPVEQVAEPLPRPGPWPTPLDPSPGWHPDPRSDSGQRYWDGTEWTQHVWRRRGA